MIAGGVRVEGLGRLVRTMKEAGHDMSDLKKANLDAAKYVLAEARPNTPSLTGSLKRTGRATATPRVGRIAFGRTAKPYAGVTHYGTPTGFRDATDRPHSQDGQSWVHDAAKATEGVWTDRYERQLMDALSNIRGL